MTQSRPAQVFPPGDLIREEIEERGWTQADLATVLARPAVVVNGIINGKRSITPETAQALSKAFGTSAQLWMNLESSYQLSKAGASSDEVARRASLFNKAPIGEMIRRGWIGGARDVAELEREVVRFFGLSSIEDDLDIPAAARTGLQCTTAFSPSQLAWMHRAKQLGKIVHAELFTLNRFRAEIDVLKNLIEQPEQARLVPKALAELGVRFVVIKHLKGTRIDGACIWLDRNTPVVAVSMRFDRIDWFWHTLIHELAHVFHEDQISLDMDVEARDKGERPDYELRADAYATDFLIATPELDNFIVRAGPLYYRDRILGFARRINVHPGIVAGQLHYRDELKYSHHRKMLEKVRPFVIANSLTDGWGTTLNRESR